MSIEAKGNTSSCEVLRIKEGNLYNVLCIEKRLRRGGKYNFPQF